MKRFISFSGGVESTTMCILYGKGATAIWCDTGAEHREMYERIDKVEGYLKDLHNGDFELVKIKAGYKVLGHVYDNLEEVVKVKKFMPSGERRYCTYYFKTRPIDEHLRNAGDCELLIGFNADEEGRTGNLEAMPNVAYRYPLIEDGLDRFDCEDVLNLHGLHPNFPVYMLRGGCRMCFFKSEKEYRAMFHLANKEFIEVMAFEEAIQDQRKKFYSIMGNGKSLRQLMNDELHQKLSFPEITELFKSLKKETSCGAFCHR